MRRAAVILFALLSACSSTTPSSSLPARSPSPGASPTASVASPSPSPSGPATFKLPAPVGAPATASGLCALPVYWPAPGQDGSVQAGFVLYPGGTPLGPVQTITGTREAFYDRAAKRWLPVSGDAIAADGLHLAYADYDLPPSPAAGMAREGPRSAGVLATTGRVHLVDAKTGADRILFSGSPTYSVIGFETAGIYLAEVQITMDGTFSSGLYLLSLTGGKPIAVRGGDRTLDRSGWKIAGGAAWGTDYSVGGGITGGNELVQLNLHTAAVTVWLTKAEGTAVYLLGLDGAGRALVTAVASGYSSTGSPAPTPPTQVLALAAPRQAKIVYTTTDATINAPYGLAVADTAGTWLSGERGALWLDSGDSLSILPVAIDAPISVGNRCIVGG